LGSPNLLASVRLDLGGVPNRPLILLSGRFVLS